jgi:hypothetical protein
MGGFKPCDRNILKKQLVPTGAEDFISTAIYYIQIAAGLLRENRTRENALWKNRPG